MRKAARSSNAAARCIYAVAEAQAGFFTARQAQNAGYSASSHTYQVRMGNWVREHRGIYRLSSYPAVLRPELARWHLWSMDRTGRAQGVYSHFTALGLYLFPEKRLPALEMTVPKSFRRNGPKPEGLVLHSADLPRSDIALGNGYRMTTPLRTILDLSAGDEAANGMTRRALSEALMEIVRRKLITRQQIRSAKIPESSRLQLEELLGTRGNSLIPPKPKRRA